jgi:hypothetical protein
MREYHQINSLSPLTFSNYQTARKHFGMTNDEFIHYLLVSANLIEEKAEKPLVYIPKKKRENIYHEKSIGKLVTERVKHANNTNSPITKGGNYPEEK